MMLNGKYKLDRIHEFGVHYTSMPGSSGQGIHMVSALNWEQAERYLQRTRFDADLVVLPELITIAGLNLTELHKARPLVYQAMESIAAISQLSPDATFFLGTPIYDESEKLPWNGLLHIRNGEVVGKTHKKIGGMGEVDDYMFKVPTDDTYYPDICLAVCRDLFGVAHTNSPSMLRLVVGHLGEERAQQIARARYITTEKVLIASCCWGVGSMVVPSLVEDKMKDDPEELIDRISYYYFEHLLILLYRIMEYNPDLEKIVVVDRPPTSPQLAPHGSKVPLNVICYR